MVDCFQANSRLSDSYKGQFSQEYAEKIFEQEVQKRLSKDPENAYIVSSDINNFRRFNKIYGYAAGDKALKDFYITLDRKMRDDEFYTSLGGDRMLYFLRSENPSKILYRQEKFLRELENNGHNVFCKYEFQVKSGICKISSVTNDVKKAIDGASKAQKSIKNTCTKHYAFFDQDLQEKMDLDNIVACRANEAIENREFDVYYQPIIRTIDKKIVAAEALARWPQKSGEVWDPGKFVPFFENNGFIANLDEYVFRNVLKQQGIWSEQGYEINPVTVNFSRLDFVTDKVFKALKKASETFNISKKFIGIEVTESALVGDWDKIARRLEQFKQYGYNILMDDFGSAYSTLIFLKQNHFDVVKIDKSFIDEIGDKRNDIIVLSIIKLVHDLGMQVLAEGVENEMQYDFLKTNECDYIQGFFLYRPMKKEQYEKLLKKQDN